MQTRQLRNSFVRDIVTMMAAVYNFDNQVICEKRQECLFFANCNNGRRTVFLNHNFTCPKTRDTPTLAPTREITQNNASPTVSSPTIIPIMLLP
jgi:hypothetical protein